MKASTRPVMIVILAVLFALSLGWFVYENFQVGQQGADLIISALLLAIPLALLYLSLGVMVESWQERRHGGLGGTVARWLYYMPRVAGILVALFTGMFALDVFSEPATLLEQIGAFLLHAAPAILMLIVAAIAWRWPLVGAVVFALAALFFLRTVLFNGFMGFGNLLLFVLPMAAVAGMFWMNWRWKGEVGKQAHENVHEGLS